MSARASSFKRLRQPPGLGLGLALLLAAALLAPYGLDAGQLQIATDFLLLLSMAQMWNLLAGYAGLMSLGHQLFVGLGAYTLFFVSGHFELNPYWVLPASGLVGALFAALVAPLMFRLREAYFSIGMWVLAEIVLALVAKSEWLGGTAGLPLRTAALLNLERFPAIAFWIACGLGVSAVLGLYLLMRTRLGLGLMSVRDNDLAATSVGVDVGRNRLIAFVISGGGCALAGAVHYMGSLYVQPASGFDADWVVAMMFIVVIGGIGTIEGPVIGALVYMGLREVCLNLLGLSGAWYLVGMGSVAIATMLFAPRGLWGLLQKFLGWRGLSVRRHPPQADSGDLA